MVGTLPPESICGCQNAEFPGLPLLLTPTASLHEGKVVTDKTYGHATYGCMVCCGYRGASFNPDSVAAGVGNSSGLDAEGLNACSSGGLNYINLDGYAGASSRISSNLVIQVFWQSSLVKCRS